MSTDSVVTRAQPDLSDIAGFWTRPIEERHAAFDELRARPGLPFFAEPVFDGFPPGPGYYALTRLDDVVAASRAAGVYSSRRGVTSVVDRPKGLITSMIAMDDPRHARLRRIVSRGFTPKMLNALTENVARITRRVVDEVVERGECDAVADLAARLPLIVICDMMGIPESQHEFVFHQSNIFLGTEDPEYVPPGGTMLTAFRDAIRALRELTDDLVRQRTAQPTDDLTSALLNAEIDGEALDPEELAGFFSLLVVAGTETTRNAISWGLQLLTENPEQRALWLADLDGNTPRAVEEIVRWSSPVIFMRRTLTEPARLSGQNLDRGDKVAMFYWAANRDPRHFEAPERFDIRRSPNPHIGFGGPGPHFCLGAHLARREIGVMFRELLTRIPDIHATAPPKRLRSMFINGVKSLPVAFTPRA